MTAHPMRARTTGLTDRRSERDMLDRLVGAVRAGQGRALVLRGDPGMGKTVLLDHLAGQASSAGCRVAHAVGVQSEMELAFAGLHQLCAPMMDHIGQIPVPQHDALRTAFGLTTGPPPNRLLVGWQCSACCRRWPGAARWSAWSTTRSGWTRPRRRHWGSRHGGWPTPPPTRCSSRGNASGNAPAPARSGPAPLTSRELQVARLIAGGRSNKQIAAELMIAQRTAENHMEHILAKLGFTSRAQVAGWVAASQPGGPGRLTSRSRRPGTSRPGSTRAMRSAE